MQKVILLSKQEIDEIKCDIIDEIIHFSSKNYGFKMISRDTGEEIIDKNQILGMLLIPINKAFDYAQDEKLQAQLKWIRNAAGE